MDLAEGGLDGYPSFVEIHFITVQTLLVVSNSAL